MTLSALGVRAGMVLLVLGVPAIRALAQELSVTGGGGAGGRPSISAPRENIRSLTDYRTVPEVNEGLAEFLELNASLPGSVTVAPVSAVAARQNLRALFTGEQNLAFLQAAQNAPQLKSADAASGAALAYFATGRGAAALACLLVARERAPQDPGVLLNLAAGALAFKQANEALALLAEAERLGPLPAGPWGLSGALRADYLKGYAFMLLGDYAQARTLLARVSAAAPQLKEAALTLALVDARLGQDPRQSYLQGVWRGRPRLMVRNPEVPATEAEVEHLPDALAEGEQVGPALADIYDITSGRPGQLRVLRVPTSPAQLREFGELSRQLLITDRREADGFRDAMVQAQTAFQKGSGTKLYKERMNQLYGLADECEQFSPEGARAVRRYRFEAKKFSERMKEIRTATMAAQMALSLKPNPKLEQELNEKAQAAITALMPHLRDYLRAIDDRYFLESTYLHGMLAHIGAPELRRALQAEGEYVRLTRQIEQIGAINELIAVAAVAKPSPLDPVVTGQKGSGQACSDEDAKWSVSVDLEVVGVSVSCQSVSFELEAPLGPPLASLSAELSVNLSGSVTVFAGPKASVAGVGSTKGGLYLTANSEGIQDIGGKVEATASSGFGPVGVSHQVGEGTVSFFPGPDQGAAPGGLPVFEGR